MAEAVQRLRRVQEAYERFPASSSSSAGSDLCCYLLSLAAHVWPSTIPHSLLVKLWMSVKDETLKQLHFYGRATRQCDKLTTSPSEELDNQLLQTINVFLSQWFVTLDGCPLYKFLNFKNEDSLARLYIVLRLTLEQNEENSNMLANTLLFKWNNYRSVRFCFQTIVRLFHTEAARRLNIIQPAWHLLEDLRLAEEAEWSGCLSALLHQILKVYLEKGPTFLEEQPTKTLLRLFSSKAFAWAFLDCITLYADPHRNASALSAAFQIFELVYANYPEAIIACCLAKAVDEQSDMVSLRLQCLNLVGKIQTQKWSFMEDLESLSSMWTEDAIRSLFTLLLRDSSVRVRRSAMQIVLPLSASNIVNKKEMLKVCLMKARDQDEKVRLTALQVLRNFPVKSLAECLTEAEWKALCKRGFAEGKKEIRSLVEALLLDFLTTEDLAESPSTRLQSLDLMGKENSPEQQSSFLYDNVESILDRELEYLQINFDH